MPSYHLRIVLPVALAAMSAAVSARDAASVYAKAKAAVVTVRTDTGSGTGFVVGDGTLVLTCWHVVDDASVVRVDETGGRNVTVVGHDAATDVALLRLSKPIKRTLALRIGPMPQPGTKVYALGTALGYLDHTISEGIVSGRRTAAGVSYIQHSAPVSHGNSGGPVLDDQGRVVGMVAFGDERGNGLNFAVASRNLSTSLSSIRARGKVPRVARAKSKSKPSVVAPPAGTGGKVVLGRLGQAKTAFLLYASPSTTAPTVGRVEAGRYLVVRPFSDAWCAVVLDSRRLAYAPAGGVTTLAYEVTQSGTRATEPQDPTSESDASADDAPTAPADPFSLGGSPESETRLRGVSIARFATAAKGAPYDTGGSSLERGVGSGEFVMLAYAAEGYELPPSPAAQAERGMPVKRYEDLQPGDRVYSYSSKATKRIDRAAIYVGGGYVVFADPKSGKVVTAFLNEARRTLTVAARRGAPLKKEKPAGTLEAPKD